MMIQRVVRIAALVMIGMSGIADSANATTSVVPYCEDGGPGEFQCSYESPRGSCSITCGYEYNACCNVDGCFCVLPE